MKDIVGMINVPAGAGKDSWLRCWDIMADATTRFGMNESLYRRQKVAYAAKAKREGWAYAGLWDSPNPIFWDKTKYRKVFHETVKLHGRGPNYRKYKGFNSPRYANVTVLEDIEIGGVQLETHINVHLAAFNNNKVPNDLVRDWHNDSLLILQRLIQAAINKGHDVWVYGDFNIPGPVKFKINGARYELVKAQGIDKIFHFVPAKEGGAKVQYEAHELKAPTDHKHGLVARPIRG